MTMHASIPGVVYPSADDNARYRALGLFGAETMAEAFSRVAAQNPTAPALSDAHHTLSWAELDARTDLLGAALLQAGLKPLDRVMFQLVNGPELVLYLIACLKAGLIPICTLAAHRMAEIGYLSRHSGARAHLIHADAKRFDFVSFAAQLREEVPGVALTVAVTGAADDLPTTAGLLQSVTPDAARALLASVPRDPREVAVFQLSGGTSGTPKIIPRFHDEYLYQILCTADFHGLGPHTTAFSPAPMMHNAPIICYWGSTLWTGGHVVCCPEMTAEAIAATIAQFRPNWLAVPLPILAKMDKEGLLDRAHFSGVRMSAPGNTRRIAELTGATAVPLYGMTEGMIAYARDSDPADIREQMVGAPISPADEFRIIDPDSGETLPEGRIGEFVFRGPCSIRGYFDAPERDAEAFTADGFVRSGDLMSLHTRDGRLWLRFDGRVKDVVSRGGEKINCQEVERWLADHPAIAAIAIVPMPDADYGERSCAFVIPAAGQPSPGLADLNRHLEARGVAKFKWPEHLELVAAFPQTSSGKMSKPLLREAAAALVATRALQPG